MKQPLVGFQKPLGVIHKPRGQKFGYFWPYRPFVVPFSKLGLCYKMVIWANPRPPSPSTVHGVYEWSLRQTSFYFILLGNWGVQQNVSFFATRITGGVGGTGLEPPSCKTDTFFLRSLARKGGHNRQCLYGAKLPLIQVVWEGQG